MLGADCERMRRRTTPSVSRCVSRALFVSVVLMALIFSSLVGALDSVGVGAMGKLNTVVVCNGTASMGSSSSAGGTSVSVPMQSGVTYLLVDCVVPLMHVAFTTAGTAAPLLENVTIVSRGGSVLPSILVNATTVNNLIVDIADVYSSATPADARRVVALDQVAVATNITVTLTRVHIENALNMTLVRIAFTNLDGLDITLVNCTLRNVTTSGLVSIVGDESTSVVANLNFTLSGGQFALVFLPEGSCGVVGITDLHSLSNVAVAARDGVSMDIQNALADRTSVVMTMLVDARWIDVVSVVHVVIDGIAANVSLDDPSGTSLCIVEIAFIATSLASFSVTIKDSRFRSQAGTINAVRFGDIASAYGVEILLDRLFMELVVGNRILSVSGKTNSVTASAVRSSSVQTLTRCSVAILESNFTMTASNGSVVQNYASVTCALILWSKVSYTSTSTFAIVRTTITITARETSVGLVLSPFLPVMPMLTLTASTFSSTQGVFENTTVIVEDVHLVCDVVVIPPVVSTVDPTAPAPLRAAFVFITLVFSNSNWTNCNISVNRSRVTVQQLQFLVSRGDAATIGEGSAFNCNTIVLLNTTALISFQSTLQYFDSCVPPFLRSLLGLSYSLSLILRDVTLSAENCVVVTTGGNVPATNKPLWPLFVAGMYLPQALSSSRISLANVSASGLSSMRTGPVIALSGTTALSLDTHVSQVNGFQLGVVSSTANAASTLWSSHIRATELDTAGALLEGNVSVATLLTATLRSCSFGHRFLLGTGAGGSSVCPSRPSAPATVAVVLQGCNKWNGRPLTPELTRRLLKESQCPASTAAAVGTVSIRAEDTCVATATLVPVVPLTVARVSTATVVVAVSALAMSAVGAASVASITSSVRMQTALGALRVGRRCALLQSDDAGDSNDDDVGSAPFDNPLQLSLPVEDTRLTFAAGCVLGNTLLFIVAAVALNVPMDTLSRTAWMRSKLWSTLSTVICRHVAAVVPGNAIVAIMLLLPPTVVSCAALTGAAAAHVGTAVSGAVCALVFAVGPVVSVGLLLWVFPLQAAAVVAARKPVLGGVSAITAAVATWLFQEPSKWVPISSAAASSSLSSSSSSSLRLDALAFRRRFGVLFAGYRGGCHWYAAVDVVVPVVSAVLSGLPPSADSSGSLPATCSWVLYALLAVFIVPCVGAVAFRPCMTRWDNLWAIVSNGLSLAVVVALVVAGSDPDLANSLTAALAWISLVPAVASVVRLIAVAWLRLRGSSEEPQERGSDVVSDSVKEKIRRGRRGMSFTCVSSRFSLGNVKVKTTSPDASLALMVRFICSNGGSRGFAAETS